MTRCSPLQYHSAAGSQGLQAMKHAVITQVLACALVLCILAVGGFASAQSIAHESQHSHHQKSTHSTVLCTWMCAAGQTHDASFAAFEHELNVVAFLEPLDLVSHRDASLILFSTRAPPQPLA